MSMVFGSRGIRPGIAASGASAPLSISSQRLEKVSSTIAAVSRKPAVTPPCSAGRIGLPISLGW